MRSEITAYFDATIDFELSKTENDSVVTVNVKLTQTVGRTFLSAIIFENTSNDQYVQNGHKLTEFECSTRTPVLIQKNMFSYRLRDPQSQVRILFIPGGNIYYSKLHVQSLLDITILPRVFRTEILFSENRLLNDKNYVWRPLFPI